MENLNIQNNMLKRRIMLMIGITIITLLNLAYFVISYLVKGDFIAYTIIYGIINFVLLVYLFIYLFKGRKLIFCSTYKVGQVLFVLPAVYFAVLTIINLIAYRAFNYEFLLYAAIMLALYFFTFRFNLKDKNPIAVNKRSIIGGVSSIVASIAFIIITALTPLGFSISDMSRKVIYETNEDGTLTVTGCYSGLSSIIDIKENYYTQKVTKISNSAFANNKLLDTAIIPAGIAEIDANSFDGIDKVVLKGNTKLLSKAMYGVKTLEIEYEDSVIECASDFFNGSQMIVPRGKIDYYRIKYYKSFNNIIPKINSDEYYINFAFDDMSQYVNTVINKKNTAFTTDMIQSTVDSANTIHSDTVNYKNDNAYYEERYDSNKKVLPYWINANTSERITFGMPLTDSITVSPKYETVNKITINYQLGATKDENIYVSDSRSYTLPTITEKPREGFNKLVFELDGRVITKLDSNTSGTLKAVWTLENPTVDFKVNNVASAKLEAVYDYVDGASVNYDIKANPVHTLNNVTYSYLWNNKLTKDTLSVSQVADSGTYTLDVVASFTEYGVTYTSSCKATYNVAIEKKETQLLFENVTATYDNLEHVLNVTTSHPEDTSSAVNIKYSSNSNPVDAGVYTAKIDIAETANYKAASTTGSVTINKRNVNITLDNNMTSIYGEALASHFTDGYYKVAANSANEGIISGTTLNIELSGVKELDNATSYTISAASLNNNYDITYEAVSYTVTKRPVTIKVTNTTSKYGDTPVLAGTVAASSMSILSKDTNTYKLETTATSLSETDSYDVNGTGLDGNYLFTFTNTAAAHTVVVRPVTVEIVAKTSAYGDDVVALTIKDGADFVNGDVPYTLSTTASSAANAGSYDITGTNTNTKNYSLTFVGETNAYTVTPRKIKVTIDKSTSVYGDNTASLSSSITEGNLVNSDANVYSISTTVNSSTGVGSYKISGKSENDNYDVAFVNGDGLYTVTKRPLTVTITSAGSYYGDDASLLSANITAGELVNSDTNVYSLSTSVTNISVVGSYDITGSIANSNYSITFVNSKNAYTVSRRPITVKVNNITTTFGTDAELTYDITGTEVNNKPAVTLSREAGNNVNTYNILVTTIDDFYDVTLTNATPTYKINKVNITVSIDNKSSVYGDSLASLSYKITSGKEYYDVKAITLTKEAGTSADTYSITPTLNDNYNVSLVSATGTYTITKRPLTVTIDSKSSEYGDALKELSAKVTSGNIISADSSKTLYKLNKTASNDTVAETSITGTSLTNDYDITFVDGTYSVTKRQITITIDNKSSVYGDDLQDLTATSTDTLAFSDTLSSLYTLSTNASKQTASTTYVITGTATPEAANYTIKFVSGKYTVTKREISIKLIDKNSTYGSDLEALEGTITSGSLAPGDTIESICTISTNANKNSAGNYTISGATTNNNYVINFTNGVYIVNKYMLNITIEAKSSQYGESLVELTANGDSYLSGDLVPYSLSTTATSKSDASTYPITGTTINDNYEISFTDATYEILRRQVGITIDSKESAYGDQIVELTYQITSGSILTGDTPFTLSTTATDTSSVGSYYSISASVTDSNYEIMSTDNTYTINKRAVTIQIDNKYSNQFESLETLTASVTIGSLANGDSIESIINLTTMADQNTPGDYTISYMGYNDNYDLTVFEGTYTVYSAE